MSIFEKTRAAIMNRFAEAWDTGAPAGLALAAIEKPNVKFDRPSGPWGRVTVAHGSRESVAVGGAIVRLTGVLFLQVFVPEDTGTKLVMDAVDHFGTLFDNQTVELLDHSGFIRFEFVQASAALTADGYHQQTFRVTWTADQNA